MTIGMSGNNNDSNKLADAIADLTQRDEDISKLIVPYLHTHLFCHAIHVHKDIKEELMSQNGKPCASFVKKHPTQLDANVHLQNSNNKD